MHLNLSAEARFWRRMREAACDHFRVALVHVLKVRGSGPREVGAMMGVTPRGHYFGTIGGGALEYRAIREALAALDELGRTGKPKSRVFDWALGPELGQCCGGHVRIAIVPFSLDQVALIDAYFQDAISSDSRQPLLLFGAGHVGRAVTQALAPLAFRVTWVDSREEAFPERAPQNVEPRLRADPVAEIELAPPGAFILIMTHDHGLDLALTTAALRRDDLPFVGLIGSATKRGRFERRLREAGFAEARIASLTCPIGLPSIRGKEPAVIAASVAAQLVQVSEAHPYCPPRSDRADEPIAWPTRRPLHEDE